MFFFFLGILDKIYYAGRKVWDVLMYDFSRTPFSSGLTTGRLHVHAHVTPREL